MTLIFCRLSLSLASFSVSSSLAFHKWNESQAGIKTAGRNIYNLRYADDIPLMAESEEELLKSLLMRMKEESEKDDLKLSIQK